MSLWYDPEKNSLIVTTLRTDVEATLETVLTYELFENMGWYYIGEFD